jgi:lysophospholipase L1-like esterase
LDESTDGDAIADADADAAAQPRPKLGRRALIALAVAAVPIFLGEGLLRFALSDRRVSPADGPNAYFAALGTHESDRPLQLPPPAPKQRFRIVVMGDSTAVGFPYAPGLSIGAFLAIGLSAAGPVPCEWEVVGKEGRSSVGVVTDLERAFALSPDLLLLYVGHNEFALRISEVSPFGRPRGGLADTIFHGYSTLFRRLREWFQFRDANDTAGMPDMFRAELTKAREWLAFGDPEQRPSISFPLSDLEVQWHLDRFEKNIRTIVAEANKRKVPLVIVEPTSNLLAAPLSSGWLFDRRAQDAWLAGTQRYALDPRDGFTSLARARDLDPAPIRLTTTAMGRLRAAAGTTPRIPLEPTLAVETDFIDLVHPTPALAAVWAERIAAQLPKDLPHLDPKDDAARERFRAACAEHLALPKVRELTEQGDGLGRLLSAVMHSSYGNRVAAESEVLAVAPEKRSFGMVVVLDLALRWRGAREEANKTLEAMAALHPDWKPSIDWWRSKADR